MANGKSIRDPEEISLIFGKELLVNLVPQMLQCIRKLLDGGAPVLIGCSPPQEKSDGMVNRIPNLRLKLLRDRLDVKIPVLLIALDDVSNWEQLQGGMSQLEHLVDLIAKDLLPGLLVESLDIKTIRWVDHDRLGHYFAMEQLDKIE